MDKYDIIEKLENAKINFNNSKRVPVLFAPAMEQLESAIADLEKEDDS